RYHEPVMVSSTDGVGSKLKVAFLANRHDTVGIDLVAMGVNDVLVHGAEPLYFLDYIGTARLDPARVETIVKGIVAGCRLAGCALVGGETAELPDLYAPGEYDLAGFAVGIVERSRIVDGSRVRPGDVVLGLASSGLHSNGYTLVRRIVFDMMKLGVDALLPGTGRTVADELLTPTRIYAKPVLALLERAEVHAMAHVTGGGLPGNLPRVLPDGCRARISRTAWTSGSAIASGHRPSSVHAQRVSRHASSIPRISPTARPSTWRSSASSRRARSVSSVAPGSCASSRRCSCVPSQGASWVSTPRYCPRSRDSMLSARRSRTASGSPAPPCTSSTTAWTPGR